MYLRVSSNGATTSSTSYSLTNAAPAKPYLQIQTGTTKWYLPLTTATVAGTRLSIKSGTSTYRAMVYSTYKTTSAAVGNLTSTTALTRASTSGTTYLTRLSTSGTNYGTRASTSGTTYLTRLSTSGTNYGTRASTSGTTYLTRLSTSGTNYGTRASTSGTTYLTRLSTSGTKYGTSVSTVNYNTTTLSGLKRSIMTNFILFETNMFSMTNKSYTNYQIFNRYSGMSSQVKDNLAISNNNIPAGYAHLSLGSFPNIQIGGSSYNNTSFVYYNGFSYSSTATSTYYTQSAIETFNNYTFQLTTALNLTSVPWVSFTNLYSMSTVKTSSKTYTGNVYYETISNASVVTKYSTETKTMTLYGMTGYSNVQNFAATYTSSVVIWTNSRTDASRSGAWQTLTGNRRRDVLMAIHSLYTTQNTQTSSTKVVTSGTTYLTRLSTSGTKYGTRASTSGTTYLTRLSTSGTKYGTRASTSGTTYLTRLSTSGTNYGTRASTSGTTYLTRLSTSGTNYGTKVSTSGYSGISSKWA